MKIRINLTEAKQAVDPKKAAAAKAADKKAEAKKKEAAKKKLKESLYPIVKKMLAENANMETMEEDTLNEFNDPSLVDWTAVAAGLGAIGLSSVLINKIHDLWQKKFPKSFKKAQDFTKAMDNATGANK